MSSILLKATIIAIFTAAVFTMSLSHEQQSTLPTDSYGTYQDQSCCPAGYNVAG